MSAKKLLLASISVVCLQASVQGDEWGLVRCLKECTNVSCADATKQEICKTNCASNLGSIDACMKAKPQGSAQTTRPTPPSRRGLPQKPQPQPLPVEPEKSKGDEEQTQLEKQGSKPPMQRRQAMAFSRPPLEKTPSTVGPSELKKQPSTKAPQRPTQPLPTTSSHLEKKPSEHHVTGAGGKGITAEEMFALNEGKGIKVKHMKEKIEGLEKLIGALEKRIGLLEPLAEHAFGAHELLARLQKNTGFDKPEIRNDPEHDIEYKPEQFSTASSATGTLDGTSCQAVLTRIQEKVKGTKDKVKAKTLSTFEAQLTEMCKLTKDLNREPAKKVHDAEAVNRIFAEAKKLF